MSKSDLAKVLDKIEGEIYVLLKENGFKKKGRSFNSETDDGLTYPSGSGRLSSFLELKQVSEVLT